jgi:uncharacterized membrane protein YdjX (TVP38/TMEM64 family)
MSADAEPIIDQPASSPQAANVSEAKVPWRKIFWLGLVAAVLMVIIYASPLHDYLRRAQELSTFVRGLGWLAPIVLTVSVAVLVAIGFPRLFFCVLSGMALGFWPGLLWAQLGTLLGNYAVFSAVRLGGGDWAERYLSSHVKLRELIQEDGISGVILARQLPLPGLFINMACGLFSVRTRDFLIGTIIGQLPEAVPCTLIGAGILEASFIKSLSVICLGVALAVGTWKAVRWALRHRHPPPSPL